MNTRIDKFKVKRLMDDMGEVGTLEELAGLAGIHSNTLYRILDNYKWNSRTLDALALALGCNPKDILTTDMGEHHTQHFAPVGMIPAMA